MRGAIHEGLPAYGRSTPITRCSLPAVCVEGVGKIASLTIHIHVLAIKTRAALVEGFVQHSPHLSQENANPGWTQAPRRGEVMGFRPPERFIGVNVSHTADQVLIQQGSLDVSVFASKGSGKCSLIKSRIERISGDVSDRPRNTDIP